MTGAIDITIPDLAISFVFVFLAGILSVYHKLQLEKDLFIGTVRTTVQLVAMAYLLKLIFELRNPFFVILMFLAMTVFAAMIVTGRVKKQRIPYFLSTLLSVQVTFFLITFIVTQFIVNVKPWWTPQYFIPIGGMIAGNSMSALAISLDRYFSDIKQRRSEVETLLCLGATAKESIDSIFKNALKAGMIPSINNMMGAGLVSIPGMMTGQILSGVSPTSAVKYQIMVMLMLVASTAIASFIVLSLVRKKSFGKGDNLLI